MAKQLQRDLIRVGVELFVDYEEITGGESLPERISAALDWCNTLVLLWSADAAQSYYVSREWTSAFHLQKSIIPCLLDATSLPALLRGRLYLDFSQYDSGYIKLRQSLGVKPLPLISLRHTSLDSLSVEDVKVMLERYDFYCALHEWNKELSNPSGKGMSNDFERLQNGTVVYDHAAGLMWQQSGSSNYMNSADVKNYIHDLNVQRFVGYNDWHLPTLEEVMSLMESKKYGNLYIDPLFDQTQWRIWTADKTSAGLTWAVSFLSGACIPLHVDSYVYVRAVHS